MPTGPGEAVQSYFERLAPKTRGFTSGALSLCEVRAWDAGLDDVVQAFRFATHRDVRALLDRDRLAELPSLTGRPHGVTVAEGFALCVFLAVARRARPCSGRELWSVMKAAPLFEHAGAHALLFNDRFWPSQELDDRLREVLAFERLRQVPAHVEGRQRYRGTAALQMGLEATAAAAQLAALAHGVGTVRLLGDLHDDPRLGAMATLVRSARTNVVKREELAGCIAEFPWFHGKPSVEDVLAELAKLEAKARRDAPGAAVAAPAVPAAGPGNPGPSRGPSGDARATSAPLPSPHAGDRISVDVVVDTAMAGFPLRLRIGLADPDTLDTSAVRVEFDDRVVAQAVAEGDAWVVVDGALDLRFAAPPPEPTVYLVLRDANANDEIIAAHEVTFADPASDASALVGTDRGTGLWLAPVGADVPADCAARWSCPYAVWYLAASSRPKPAPRPPRFALRCAGVHPLAEPFEVRLVDSEPGGAPPTSVVVANNELAVVMRQDGTRVARGALERAPLTDPARCQITFPGGRASHALPPILWHGIAVRSDDEWRVRRFDGAGVRASQGGRLRLWPGASVGQGTRLVWGRHERVVEFRRVAGAVEVAAVALANAFGRELALEGAQEQRWPIAWRDTDAPQGSAAGEWYTLSPGAAELTPGEGFGLSVQVREGRVLASKLATERGRTPRLDPHALLGVVRAARFAIAAKEHRSVAAEALSAVVRDGRFPACIPPAPLRQVVSAETWSAVLRELMDDPTIEAAVFEGARADGPVPTLGDVLAWFRVDPVVAARFVRRYVHGAENVADALANLRDAKVLRLWFEGMGGARPIAATPALPESVIEAFAQSGEAADKRGLMARMALRRALVSMDETDRCGAMAVALRKLTP